MKTSKLPSSKDTVLHFIQNQIISLPSNNRFLLFGAFSSFEENIIFLRFIFSLLVLREESEGKLKGILGYTEDEVVSTDFVGDNRYGFIFSRLNLYEFEEFGIIRKFLYFYNSKIKSVISMLRILRRNILTPN